MVSKWTVKRKKQIAERVRSLDAVLGWLADVLEAPKQLSTQASDNVAVPRASRGGDTSNDGELMVGPPV